MHGWTFVYAWLHPFPALLTSLCVSLNCSVRTPISMKFFPRFFLLYFLVFHIYFFSYSYGMVLPLIQLAFILVGKYYFHQRDGFDNFPGFSYLALSATAAFMQHLILYFWNRFEVTNVQSQISNQQSL